MGYPPLLYSDPHEISDEPLFGHKHSQLPWPTVRHFRLFKFCWIFC